MLEAEREAYALHYKAKHRMAEVKKMRKFYKPGESAEDRKKAIAERMKVTACHNCGEVGHWSRECPRASGKAQNVYMATSARQRRPTAPPMATVREADGLSRDEEWQLLSSLCSQVAEDRPGPTSRAYMVRPGAVCPGEPGQNEVLWCMQELRSSVILDLGCLKSVAGTQWINQVVNRWKSQGRWFKVFEEKEVFRFGNGETLTSRYGLVIHCTFAGKDVVLNFSVVKGDCPPLLSRPACTQLGIIFDCSQHTLSSRKLQVKQYGLTQTASGHYVMNIEEFSEASDTVRVPEDFRLSNGDDAIVWEHDQNVLAAQISRSRSTRQPSHASTDGILCGGQQTLSSMRRHIPQDSRMSDDPIGRGVRCIAERRHGDGRHQRGQLLQEGRQGTSSAGGIDSEEGTSRNSEELAREGEFGMDGGPRHQAGELPGDLPHRPGRLPAHPEGDGEHSEAEGEGEQECGQEDRDQGSDGDSSRLSVIESRMELRGPVQFGRKREGQDGDVYVEEAGVADEDEAGHRDHHAGSSMEEEQEMASDAVRQGGRSVVGPLRSSSPTHACADCGGADVSEEEQISPEGLMSPSQEAADFISEPGSDILDEDALPWSSDGWDEGEFEYDPALEEIAAMNVDKEDVWQRPQRGLTQKMKKSVKLALEVMREVENVPTQQATLMVLEVFAGHAMVTKVAARRGGWGAYNPVDVIYGEEFDLRERQRGRDLVNMVREMQPDLVVITPPCGPWCQWQRLAGDIDRLYELRRTHLPFWKLTKELWDIQDEGQRLVLTEQPVGSEALNLKYMSRREQVYRVVVDQCRFGLKDPVSGKRYKKTTALDVNDKEFAYELARIQRCHHRPEEHEQIQGNVYFQGKWQRRSTLAAKWTDKLATHVLTSAERALFYRQKEAVRNEPEIEWSLAEPNKGEGWEVNPVEVEEKGGVLTPEEVLRRQLNSMGAEGERYDYINFEGTSRGLPRRLRSTLAHLHVVLGHLSNERLARMLSLAGASKELLGGVREMRCQVCNMVRPPQSRPQVSYSKPTNFNQRISGDCFHVWDIENVRYTVVHFLDDLTDYHVGDVQFDARSDWTAEILRRKWYDVFGPPDILLTDSGTEFRGSMERLNDLFAVQHDMVPDQAKWRLGHAERHGAILKLMMMKTVTAARIDTLEEMQHALTAALGAKNRLTTKSGVSPLQAVTGRNSPLPGSLLAQICSGKVKYVTNEALDQDEAIRRAERIRAAAIESCHWLDAHEGLRRALATRSRPPHLELVREGTVVYVYDPPAHRKGLARRLQDNVSWSGPAVVVCVERQETIPKKVWVRRRNKVKAYPLEKIRLATADEMVSAEFITDALKEVQEELDGGTLRVAEDPVLQLTDQQAEDPKEEERPVQARAVRPKAQVKRKVPPTPPRAPASSEDSEMPRAMEKKREFLHDVPEALDRKKLKPGAAVEEPSHLAFEEKRKLFERLAEDLLPPTHMQEAAMRSHLEGAYEALKKVRKTLKKEKKEEARSYAARTSTAQPSERQAFVTTVRCAAAVSAVGTAEAWDTSEYHAKLWEEEEGDGKELVQQVIEMSEKASEAEMHAVLEAKLVTGKLRVEYRWTDLSPEWKEAYKDPLVKAVNVYFEHEAIRGVDRDAMVDPRKILSSRFVLTNKGKEILEEAELKARWIIGGHRDQDLGKYPTLAPTSSLLGHNLLNFLAVQFGWVVHYEDVSAAFLQGKPLPPEREVYVKLPAGYPEHVNEFILGKVGQQCRGDLLRLLKGGFGLAESPRLWYMEYKSTLKDIDLHELKLVPGMFAAWHPNGKLRAMVCIHVDDTRYAGDETAETIWEELHKRLKFGKLRRATEGWTKFCGRWERQDPQTFEITYSMDEYCANIPDLDMAKVTKEGELTAEDRVKLGSILGQVNWAARQGRYDLSYGVSHCQQLAGLGQAEAKEWVRKVVGRAKKSVELRVPRLHCEIEDMVVISASDAAYAAQPRAASQGGVVCLLANPAVTDHPSPVAIVEAQSMKISRVVRCSMAAELSMAAESFEHGDFLRAVLGELLVPTFELRRWKWFASRWRHYLVIDAKTGYDVLNNESMTSDRKIMIDAATLREALIEEGSENFVRWIPGREMVADGLTKWSDNGILAKVMVSGEWCLVDTEEAQRLRAEAGYRKRKYDAKRRLTP